MLQLLQPHPSTKSHPLKWLQVDVTREMRSSLRLRYKIAGAIGDVAWPDYRGPVRCDNLWQHTCCELFLRAGHGPQYLEFNFAPSLAWAAYEFAGYREGQTEAPIAVEPRIGFLRATEGATLTAAIENLPEGEWHLNLSAVIEEADGTKSYWALAHPPGKPDFHHPDCFALTLPAPGGA